MDNLENLIDCRGLACPEPLIRVKEALKKHQSSGKVSILLSSATAKDNVVRLVKKMGWNPEIIKIEDGYRLIATK